MNISVYGIANDVEHLERIIASLDAAGFKSDCCSVIYPEEAGHPFGKMPSTKAPDGPIVGASVAGAGVGGILGILVGMGTLLIPGIGPLIAFGPLLTMLSGAAVGAAAGGVAGSFIGLGVTPQQAMLYETSLREGRYLIVVHCESQELADKAERILTEASANDIAIH